MAEFLPLSVAAAIAYGSLVDGQGVARDRSTQRLDFADGSDPVLALRIRGSDLSMAIELLRLRPPLLARR